MKISLIASSPETARHPPRGESRREGEAQRRARALRCYHALVDQGRDYAAGLPFSRADDRGSITARSFTAIEQRFEDVVGFGRQFVQTNLLLPPTEMRARSRSGCISSSMNFT